MSDWQYVYTDHGDERGRLYYPGGGFVPVDGRPPCGIFTKLWFDGLRGWKVASGAQIALTATEVYELRAFLTPCVGEAHMPPRPT